jgi:hypothetical protein
MTAVKSVTAKPISGFARKKALEEIGCTFEKLPNKLDLHSKDVTTWEWVCVFDNKEVGRHRLQGPCVDEAIDHFGGL